MTLFATLTLGWPETQNDSIPAQDFLESLSEGQTVAGQLCKVARCEALFRRRPGGFNQIRKFALDVRDVSATSRGTIECQFDAFAYAFLKRAKNFDLLVPLRQTTFFADESTEQHFDRFRRELKEVGDFEFCGATPSNGKLKELYLALRGIVVRPSARDERRMLATLFVAGPSTPSDLAVDSGSSENLTQRILNAFSNAGAVTKANDEYQIDNAALAPAYYLARETFGLSLLEQYL